VPTSAVDADGADPHGCSSHRGWIRAPDDNVENRDPGEERLNLFNKDLFSDDTRPNDASVKSKHAIIASRC
jgi:hypothetical protein